MGYPFMGEIKLISFNFAPKGWALCNGQLLPINTNQALFSLLGTTYGGNGQTTFALPDLRGRTPIHWGGGVTLGEKAGEEFHTLIQSEMPVHNHVVSGTSTAADSKDPTNRVWAPNSANPYSNQANSALGPTAISTVGGSKAHENRQPYVVLNFAIALNGNFPSRD